MKNKLAIGSLLALLSALPLCAAHYPSPQGRVTDAAHLLDAATRQNLEQQLADFDQRTSNEIAVVTVPSLEGEPIETYAVTLFKKWGIGKKGKDNGLLILVAPVEHQSRIEVGYGLEGQIPDGLAGAIIREQLRPAFREGRYGEGITSAVSRIIRILGGDAEAAQYSSNDDLDLQVLPWWANVALLLFFGGFFILIFVAMLFSVRRSGRGSGGWTSGGGFGGFGGFGGGFGGGGFGGFGGGGSGGGGASGGW